MVRHRSDCYLLSSIACFRSTSAGLSRARASHRFPKAAARHPRQQLPVDPYLGRNARHPAATAAACRLPPARVTPVCHDLRREVVQQVQADGLRQEHAASLRGRAGYPSPTAVILLRRRCRPRYRSLPTRARRSAWSSSGLVRPFARALPPFRRKSVVAVPRHHAAQPSLAWTGEDSAFAVRPRFRKSPLPACAYG